MGVLIACGYFLAALALFLGLLWPRLKTDPLQGRFARLAGQAPAPTAKPFTFRLPQAGGKRAAQLRRKLIQAGHREPGALADLVRRQIIYAAGFCAAAGLLMLIGKGAQLATLTRLCVPLVALAAGYFLPVLLVENDIQKRREQIARGFPDAMDLMLICAEAGLAVDASWRRVASELGADHPALGDELEMTAAELSYLPERRQAFENLIERTDSPAVRIVAQALIQAERYGTPVATTLRAVAQDVRDERVAIAEKAAGALPAKLTVPMIVFFLPALLVVILGPAVMTMTRG
ncbi:type II secretion system F family protein [Lacibacterium aquatile]|uniref:Type II secretion system F family protein n=1 Tax=Lacibacterium aquatile TaxID=1168082 RepID=A0ABW5DV03_9PROT